MKPSRIMATLLAVASLVFATAAQARPASPNVGMEEISAPVSGDAAVSVTIWYPSTSAAHTQILGSYKLDVAMAGVPVRKRLPLIIISHGAGGSALDSLDLAVALAKAGFVVAAVEHKGDSYRDRSRSFSRAAFSSRARQISASIDFMTKSWHYKSVVDSGRIGMFGHSAGGTTALIAGGGVLDWGQVIQFCISHPQDMGCSMNRTQHPTANEAKEDVTPIAAPDPRVKALVVGAPALTHGFAPAGLAKLKPPVQLWVAGKDAIVLDAGMVAALMPTKPEQHDVANAGHVSFLSPCPEWLRAMAQVVCQDPKGFSRESFQQEFAREIVRFFRTHLRG